MLATKRNLKTDPATAEFEASRERWAEADTKHRELIDRSERMTLALSLTTAGIDKRTPQHLREKAQPFLRLAVKRRSKFLDQLADLADEIEDHTPVFQAASEDWERAQRSETNRIAIGLQDRHRAAVQAIATALEALSRALAAEREVHDELSRRAPQSVSPNLPNMSADLFDSALSEWGTTAWRWARRVRQLKILE